MSSPLVLNNPSISFQLPSTTSSWLALLVPSFLFAILAPGGFLRIPPAEFGPNKGKIFTFGSAEWTSILVHTVVFAILLWILRALFPSIRG